MVKRTCSLCSSTISASNYLRHIAACDGTGTWLQKEAARKERTKSQHYRCLLCEKELSCAQALAGHLQRSHTNKERQKTYSKKGRELREGLPGAFSGKKHTERTKQQLSVLACERLAKHSKYTQNVEYRPGTVLESSYEVRTAVILDALGVEWIKVRTGYVWNDAGKIRRYVPDFYLPEYDIFLDPKNDYLIKKDRKKIESAMELNNIRVIVLSDAEISEEFIKDMLP